MKSRLVRLPALSGGKASIYSIITETGKLTFFDHFIAEHKGDFMQDLMNILGRLRSIGNTVGAIETFFKLDEGLEWDDLVCALYDTPGKHLRLYCVRLNDHIIILGNGGPKNVRAWQDDPKLTREVTEMMYHSKIIRDKLKGGGLRISPDRLKLEGDLMLTR